MNRPHPWETLVDEIHPWNKGPQLRLRVIQRPGSCPREASMPAFQERVSSSTEGWGQMAGLAVRDGAILGATPGY